MTGYLVTWEIEVEARSPREAAEKARRIQQDPDTHNTVFTVGWDDGDEVVNLQDRPPTDKAGVGFIDPSLA